MTFSEELIWRGLIKDHTFSDTKWLNQPQTFYLGADAGSADSLTVGNLAIFMLARRLLDAGWKTVLLMGGATSMIGDPGGKDSERDLVSKEQIAANIAGVKSQVEALFAGKDFTLVNNYDWFNNLGYLQFLRDVGKHFSMTELLQRDYIVDRIGEGGTGISYAEFSYSIIQGYDFWHLYKNHGVVLQIGGSDQWGNMLSGVPLIRKREAAEAHALSIPLVINKTTGKKFGKSEDGAVWLDQSKTSVYKFYQFWLNSGDHDAVDYLKIYTLLTPDQINTIAQEMSQSSSGRHAQKSLAYEVTALVHGKDRAESVKRVSEVLFGGAAYNTLSAEDFKVLESELHTETVKVGDELIYVLVATQLASSKTEARRFLQESAVYINGSQFSLNKTTITADDIINGYIVLKRGKNASALLHVD
jgi:tyrosyl-tRNA synthetase